MVSVAQVNANPAISKSSWQVSVRRLQIITIAWMLLECGVAAYAAYTAHSPSMLAFGSDSLVELFSASVVLLQFAGRHSISERSAARLAGLLLFLLAAVVVWTSLVSLLRHREPETSWAGVTISAGALLVMPLLAAAKLPCTAVRQRGPGGRCSSKRDMRLPGAARSHWRRAKRTHTFWADRQHRGTDSRPTAHQGRSKRMAGCCMPLLLTLIRRF